MVRFPRERNNSTISSVMRRFSKVIEKLHLRDLPLAGGVFYLVWWPE